ncbi:hypothetical protein [Gracilimonas sp.]|uniref:hypothetical protein n=1 Tax=Gracilimonas sp. TaxID=1974203 RepID=UPI003BA8BDAD
MVIIVLVLLIQEAIQIVQSPSFSFNALLDTLVFASLITFRPTLLFLILTFKWNKKNYFLWLVILFNLPVFIFISPDLYQNIRLSFIDTTTPSEFINSNDVDRLTYINDVKRIEQKVDSLIRIGVVTQPTDYRERYFEGTTYKDTLERRRGFPATPYKLPIELTVDTLFYSPDISNLIAGTLIRKYPVDFPEYSNGDTVEFIGNAFIFNPNNYGFKFLTLQTTVSGYDSKEECAKGLNRVYLKERGLRYGLFNLNDIRLWSNTDWESKFKPYSSI